MEMENEGEEKNSVHDEMFKFLCALRRHHLEDDEQIVFGILIRLGAKDAVRYSCVCKGWFSLIKTPYFISSHLSFSSSRSQSQPSLVLVTYKWGTTPLSAHSDPKRFKNHCLIPFPKLLSDPHDHHGRLIVGIVHGLICLCEATRLFCFWNPSVNRYIPLPSPMDMTLISSALTAGFCFDERNNDYKLLVGVHLREKGVKPSWRLFSLKKGNWKTLDNAGEASKCIIWGGPGTLVNGALHWTGYKSVVAFDVVNEKFGEMELPHEVLQGRRNFCILEVKGSLACLDLANEDDRFNIPATTINNYSIWVMTKYGMADSWTKMWTLQMKATLSWIFGVWVNGDEILYERETYSGRSAYFLYDTKTQGTRYLGGGVTSTITDIHAYTESLILLDNEGAVSHNVNFNPPPPSGSTRRKRKRERSEEDKGLEAKGDGDDGQG